MGHSSIKELPRQKSTTLKYENAKNGFQQRSVDYEFVRKSQTLTVNFKKNLQFIAICPRGAREAEWYHTWLSTLVCCAMPWAVSLSQSLYQTQGHNIYAFS